MQHFVFYRFFKGVNMDERIAHPFFGFFQGWLSHFFIFLEGVAIAFQFSVFLAGLLWRGE